MRKLKQLTALLAGLLVTACASMPEPKDYTTFREASPRSILVVPVVNHSAEPEASRFFLTTMPIPLAERGYYVFSTNMVRALMENEGLADPYLVHSSETPRVAELFGADAVLYVEILDWRSSYKVISSDIVVHFLYTLKDGRTNQLLWQDEEEFVYSKSANSNNLIANVIANAVIAAVDNVSVDYTPVANTANARALLPAGQGIPFGPYSASYQKDAKEFPSLGSGNISNAESLAIALGGLPPDETPTEAVEESGDADAETAEEAVEEAKAEGAEG